MRIRPFIEALLLIHRFIHPRKKNVEHTIQGYVKRLTLNEHSMRVASRPLQRSQLHECTPSRDPLFLAGPLHSSSRRDRTMRLGHEHTALDVPSSPIKLPEISAIPTESIPPKPLRKSTIRARRNPRNMGNDRKPNGNMSVTFYGASNLNIERLRTPTKYQNVGRGRFPGKKLDS